jgi:hypothetical protein
MILRQLERGYPPPQPTLQNHKASYKNKLHVFDNH